MDDSRNLQNFSYGDQTKVTKRKMPDLSSLNVLNSERSEHKVYRHPNRPVNDFGHEPVLAIRGQLDVLD